MGRKEQIKHKAGSIADGMISNYVPQDVCDNYYQGFIDGAKWADKTMIDKAREWVKNAFVGTFEEGMANSIADEFVKAMEK